MKFNIKNYEEYALEYLEGSLLKSEQEEFAAFLLLHPEIREELEAFELMTLSPDVSEVFAGKDELYREKKGPSYRLFAMLALLVALIFSVIWSRHDQPMNAKINEVQSSAYVASEAHAVVEEQIEPPKIMTEDKVVEEDIVVAKINSEKRSTGIDELNSGSNSKEITTLDVSPKMTEAQPLDLGSPSEEKLHIFEKSRISQEKWNIERLPLLKIVDQIPHQKPLDKIEIIHPALIKAFSTNPEMENEPQSKVGKWLTKVHLVPSTFDKPEQSEIKNKLLPSYFSAE